jgi:ribosomal protein S18 acetylase RimI-like enzyme
MEVVIALLSNIPLRVISLLILLSAMAPCHAYKFLGVKGGYCYEIYEPRDIIPDEVLDEAREMYFQAYDDPTLHDGLTLQEMRVDERRFSSYEEFIDDMFRKDFSSYHMNPSRSLFQVRDCRSNAIVGVCAVLHQEKPGHYYIDHIGVEKNTRRKKMGTLLIYEVVNEFSDFEEIRLDTRVFNTPAQRFYENLGFKRWEMHPNPLKTSAYVHYELTPSILLPVLLRAYSNTLCLVGQSPGLMRPHLMRSS